MLSKGCMRAGQPQACPRFKCLKLDLDFKNGPWDGMAAVDKPTKSYFVNTLTTASSFVSPQIICGSTKPICNENGRHTCSTCFTVAKLRWNGQCALLAHAHALQLVPRCQRNLPGLIGNPPATQYTCFRHSAVHKPAKPVFTPQFRVPSLQ